MTKVSSEYRENRVTRIVYELQNENNLLGHRSCLHDSGMPHKYIRSEFPIQMHHRVRGGFPGASDQFVSFDETFRALHYVLEICDQVDHVTNCDRRRD